MNKYVNKTFIELALKKGINDIKEDRRRGTRNLVDLACLFSKNETQSKVFKSVQKVLKNQKSEYFTLMENIVKDVDEEKIKTFSYNIGYNSLIEGTKLNKKYNNTWAKKYNISNTAEFNYTKNEIERLKKQGLKTYFLFIDYTFEKVLEIIGENIDCGFIIFTELDNDFLKNIQDYGKYNNVLYSFKLEENKEFKQAIKKLVSNKLLFGTYVEYDENNYKKVVKEDYTKLNYKLNSKVIFFIQKFENNETNKNYKKEVYQNICATRWDIKYPVFLIDLDGDINTINRELFF